MQKIVTRESSLKSQQRRSRTLTFLMLLILLGSTAGYAFLSYTGSADVNTENQIPQTGWSSIVGGKEVFFQYKPQEVSDVSIIINTTLQTYLGVPLYVDSADDSVTGEIAATLGSYTLRTQPACYGSCERNLPEKTCNENLIIWRQGIENSVRQENLCIFITGDMTAVDAFLYRVLGIA